MGTKILGEYGSLIRMERWAGALRLCTWFNAANRSDPGHALLAREQVQELRDALDAWLASHRFQVGDDVRIDGDPDAWHVRAIDGEVAWLFKEKDGLPLRVAAHFSAITRVST